MIRSTAQPAPGTARGLVESRRRLDGRRTSEIAAGIIVVSYAEYQSEGGAWNQEG